MQYEHIRTDRIDRCIESLNLSTRGSARDRADRIDAYFRAQIDKGKEILVCDVCDGHSPEDYDDCPYCGETGVDFTRTKPITDVDEGTGIQNKTVYYEDDLDRIHRELQRCKRVASTSLYRIGKLLAAVRGKALWRMRHKRPHQTAERIYDTYDEWLKSEGFFSAGSADRLIKLTGRLSLSEFTAVVTEIPACIRTWDLKNRVPEIRDVDFSKIELPGMKGKPILRFSERDGWHIEIYEEAPDGKITVELEQEDGSMEIVRIPEALNRTPVHRRFTRPVRPENRMERVDVNFGMSRVKMWKRGYDGCDKVPAVELKDDPWLELHLNETVKLEVRLIQGPDGGIEAICETKRHMN